MRKLEFISTGNEILSGLTLDTNFSWAADKFSSNGIIPSYHVSVGDDEKDISTAFSIALGRSAFIVVTGGLGPTDDDLTAKTAADFFGVELTFDETSYSELEEKLRSRGRKVLGVHKKQAMFPVGSEIIKNITGTSNGFKFIKNDCSFYFLPGVPREFKSMIEGFVLPDILRNSGSDNYILQKVIKTIGLGESEVAVMLKSLKIDNADLSFRIKYPEIHLKLVAKSSSMDEAKKIIGLHTDAIYKSLENYIYTDKDESIEKVVADLLLEKNLTISTAESCTGGLLGNLLTDIPGSSDYFLHGVISYSNESKSELLGVDEDLFETVGAVSKEVVHQMASGIRRISSSDIGVGISGIAGPGGGSEEKPVGTVYIGVDYMNHVYSYRYNFHGTRKDIKLASAEYALDIIRNLIINNHKN